jgi:glycosyltransferase involved in cell wall biosynthesis
VIAADAGGLGEVARAGACNVIFRPGDSTEITKALSVVGDIGIQGAMLRRPLARQTYEAHFTSELMAKRSIAVYESVLSGCEFSSGAALCT